MKILQELNYENELKKISEEIETVSDTFSQLLERDVHVNEHDENQLNAILNDAERRIDAAKRGLALASKIKDPAERKLHKGKMLSHLNRTRNILDQLIKQYFSEKVGADEVTNPNDEFLTPEQAIRTLGITPSKLQQLVASNQLKMYNDNGRWALKGSEVQAVLDKGPTQKPAGNPANRADFSRFVQ